MEEPQQKQPSQTNVQQPKSQPKVTINQVVNNPPPVVQPPPPKQE